ncbi:MogA/MoaB family molybdenum cofactor biosynthesis protein [Candidatus Magnetominusculus xianensis]|uniref:Molybdopterin adenylyltransferase n=1 Tax=Candidatus Magnetominusculus xianensis TaxID=1748249 RepID=A0ABR5SI18_9BACT|nr:MogA/MoaB family molybdenum cofactor biosynthesis protein [Candidatus Magnetominusculus xianensis]KWT91884.1 molybdenum cofactor biosynthesis protein [Candidatus Magnetominusculus xianensis]MBF0404076.1 MogA/MoaB family molybdenum cofactor biosynthesis protein [Nitrospirota bacterium]
MTSITAAVLTISDKGSTGQRVDEGGPAICELLSGIGAEILFTEIIPDEKEQIKARLIAMTQKVDLVITTGGTGLSPRDVTPDATLEVIDKEIPGIGETMRAEGLRATRRSMLSRAVAGTRGSSLIVNLPGSVKAVRENLAVILDVLPHAIEKIKGGTSDCGR